MHTDYAVESDGGRATVFAGADEEYVFVRDGRGGVTLTSQPNRRSRSRSEMRAIFDAARAKLYEAA